MALPFVDMDMTITMDQTPVSGEAIIFNADNVKVTIDTNINVVSRDSNAVLNGAFDGAELINKGNIFSAAGHGVASGDFGETTIVNEADASIVGLLDGIHSDARVGSTITNHGTVRGLQENGVGFRFDSDDVILNNDGDISGRMSGVSILSINDGGVFHNSGTIHSEGSGLFISTRGFQTVIDNEAGGVIQGALAIVTEDQLAGVTPGGRIALDNRGTVDGDIDLNAATGNVNDVVINQGDQGDIIGDVFLGSGNDQFRGKGHSTSGDVFGEAGNDTLSGSKADDTLDGGADSDLVRGGRGKDKLFGGADGDTFDFNSIKDSKPGSKKDKIMDFQRGLDDIDLKSIDAKTEKSGNQTFKWIGKSDFHDKKGELRYKEKDSKVVVKGDVNGDGHADFHILVKGVVGLSDDDFVL
jgi:Ca2+-binding RTX toxin-like protein